MDWEGGTNGAIVPALMGHGEAGRASPWPFSCADVLDLHPKAPTQNSRRRKLRRLFLLSVTERYENSCCTMLPSRTKVMGRPVVESYSSVGSIPKLW
jgi:hypothetical protein